MAITISFVVSPERGAFSLSDHLLPLLIGHVFGIAEDAAKEVGGGNTVRVVTNLARVAAATREQGWQVDAVDGDRSRLRSECGKKSEDGLHLVLRPLLGPITQQGVREALMLAAGGGRFTACSELHHNCHPTWLLRCDMEVFPGEFIISRRLPSLMHEDDVKRSQDLSSLFYAHGAVEAWSGGTREEAALLPADWFEVALGDDSPWFYYLPIFNIAEKNVSGEFMPERLKGDHTHC